MNSPELSSAEHYLELSRRAESALNALNLTDLLPSEGPDGAKWEAPSLVRGRRRFGQERHPLKNVLAGLTERTEQNEESSALTDYLSKVDLDVLKIAHDSEGTL